MHRLGHYFTGYLDIRTALSQAGATLEHAIHTVGVEMNQLVRFRAGRCIP
jgi:hypothetical protein